MSLPEHETLLLKLFEIYPLEGGWQRKGFRKKVKKYLCELGNASSDVENEMPHIVPDGFYIDKENQNIILAESWHSHKTDLDKIYDLWWAMDEFYVTVELITINKRAEIFRASSYDLFSGSLVRGAAYLKWKNEKSKSLFCGHDADKL